MKKDNSFLPIYKLKVQWSTISKEVVKLQIIRKYGMKERKQNARLIHTCSFGNALT